MFDWLGQLVSRAWWLILLVWVGVLIGLRFVAPDVSEVTQAGEFNFLPDDAKTRQGEIYFQKAFPSEVEGGGIVIVFTRKDNQDLTDADLNFIEETLKPRLLSLMPPPESEEEAANEDAAPPPGTAHPYGLFPDIVRVRSPSSREIGKLLLSDDKRSALVSIETSVDYLSYRILKPVAAVERVLESVKDDELMPSDLQYTLTGSAVAGRDIGVAQSRSADSIERWTLILIVSLLLIVYRAPLPVLVPLATLVVALKISMRLLAWAAEQGWIGLFEGVEIYTVVVAYGAGVDFSMFLTSRFHEEIQRNDNVNAALTRTLKGVGPAVVAAASTVIFGIGMMTFASFGKFHQAGITISFSLLIILLAALTFTPSLLKLMGRYTFWPEMPEHGVEFRTQQVGLLSRIMRRVTFQEESHIFWERLASWITRYPGRAWLVTMAAMVPFAIVGWVRYENVSYGLIASLRSSAPSVVGTADISKHFSPGMIGPVTLLLEQPDIDFSTGAGERALRDLSNRMKERASELDISDVRSLASPLGYTHQLGSAASSNTARGTFNRILQRNAQRTSVREHFLGKKTESGTHVTRLEILLNADPFARESIGKLNRLDAAIPELLPEELKSARYFLLGATASIRDLEIVASQDRIKITVLVTLAVFVVLLFLIRSVFDSMYLMATVIFSFLCTLGVSYLLFYSLDPQNFPGLDWTVPTFLFTILVAVGQDYNIFLVTRIHEEREHHGPLGSVRHAVVQTAAIITSCGLIMAGTFSAMIVGGELARMTQLGFALAFGVLLDTMVVRPILVPAYFAWRARREQNRKRAAAHPHTVESAPVEGS